ncbi:hypothetical protein D9756_002582 [Leucocoprinus leucothites]|uniref:Nephrocystin 3-like N-terminal domain-containing protein n=1 Tax=Leucocoprinus leucothites TaxID=201217 RepID=A0A8H5LLV2_9AGAR|nr:hypothetical protein D9756_002582 [Leucoagaricus leucothites]
MDLNWCLTCGKQFDDEREVYCSLECQRFDDPSSYRRREVADSKPPALDFRSIHDWANKVPLKAKLPEIHPREDVQVFFSHAPSIVGPTPVPRSSPPVPRLAPAARPSPSLVVRLAPVARPLPSLFRAPRPPRLSSTVSPSLSEPKPDTVLASPSLSSNLNSSQELLTAILHSQSSGNITRVPMSLSSPNTLPPSTVLAIRPPQKNWSSDRRRTASNSLPHLETRSPQRRSWTSSTHTLSQTNTQSTSSTLADSSGAPVTSIKFMGKSPKEMQVTSTTPVTNDHSIPTAGGLFSHSHDFVVPNANLYSIGSQHQYYYNHATGHINVLERLAKYIMPGAQLDSSLREYPPRCHPGTRSDILSSIRRFLHDDIRMIRISGPAGAGKSAIMQTVVENETKNHLRAALFLSKKEGIDDARRIFSTIAYQLAVQNEGYLSFLEETFRTDPLFMEKSLSAQFQSLVVTPFIRKCVPLGSERCTILIDALDDCQDERDQYQVLQLILDFVSKHPIFPITWVFATRPKPHIATFFAQIKRKTKLYRECHLSISSKRSRRDVKCYLEAELGRIKNKYPERIPPSSCWPAKDHFSSITSSSSGFFLYATAIVNFVDKPGGDPVFRLLACLDGGSGPGVSNENPFRTLDFMYSEIMSEIPAPALPQIQLLLGYYMSPVDLSQDQTSLLLACNLPGLEHCLDSVLGSLLSVLAFPLASVMRTQGLHFLHTSFVEYLQDQSRSSAYWIDLEHVLTEMWRRCACILLQWSEIQSSELILISWKPDTAIPGGSVCELRDEIFWKASSLWTNLLYKYCHRWCATSCTMKIQALYCLTLSAFDILDILQQLDYRNPAVFGENPVDMAKFFSWLLEHAPIELRNQLVLQEFHLSMLNKPRFFKALCERKWYIGITEQYQRFQVDSNAVGLAAIRDLPASEWFVAEAALAGVHGSLGDLVRLLQGAFLPNNGIVTILGTGSTNCCGLLRHQKSPHLSQYHIFPYSDSDSCPASIAMCSLD